MKTLIALLIGAACFAQPAAAEEPEQKVVVRAWMIDVPETWLNHLGDAAQNPERMARWLMDRTLPIRGAAPGPHTADLLPLLDADLTQPPISLSLPKPPFGQGIHVPWPYHLNVQAAAVETTSGEWRTFDDTKAIQYLELQAEPPRPQPDPNEPRPKTYVLRTLEQRAGTQFKAKPEIRPDGQVAVEFELSWARVMERMPVEGAEFLPVGKPALSELEVRSELVARRDMPVIAHQSEHAAPNADQADEPAQARRFRRYLLMHVDIQKPTE